MALTRLASTLQTLVVVYFTFLVPSPLDVHAGIWGLVVNVGLFVGVSLLTQPMDRHPVDRFVEGSKLPIGGR